MSTLFCLWPYFIRLFLVSCIPVKPDSLCPEHTRAIAASEPLKVLLPLPRKLFPPRCTTLSFTSFSHYSQVTFSMRLNWEKASARHLLMNGVIFLILLGCLIYNHSLKSLYTHMAYIHTCVYFNTLKMKKNVE